MAIRTSDSTKFLTAALIEFHKSEVSVPKTASNPFFKSKFADLWTIKSQCDPVLNGLGLVVTQFPGMGDVGQSTLITRLAHTSGEWMEAEMPLLLPKESPQGQGSAITYARRYSYTAILGIVADPDDDAVFVPPTEDNLADVLHESLAQRPAENSGDAATTKQLAYLRSLVKDNGMADADLQVMVSQHCPPWPGELNKLSKGQAGSLIEALK